VAALGAAAVQDGCAGFGGHANEESVDLAATAAVGLKGALGHDFSLSCSSSMEDEVFVLEMACVRRLAKNS
jgi:hypothetical protein